MLHELIKHQKKIRRTQIRLQNQLDLIQWKQTSRIYIPRSKQIVFAKHLCEQIVFVAKYRPKTQTIQKRLLVLCRAQR